MPALSPTMEVGTLGKWYKNVGDEVQPGDVLGEVQTDKATLEWESTAEGVVARVFVDVPSQLQVGQPVAVICEEKDDVKAFENMAPPATAPVGGEAAAAPQAPAQTPSPSPPVAGRKPHGVLSPAVLAIANANPGFDFSGVRGTGRNGMLLKGDLLKALQGKSPQAPAATPPPPAAAAVAAPAAAPAVAQVGRGTVGLSAKSAIPHFYLVVDCAVDRALSYAAQVKGASLHDVVVRAASRALELVPNANATWADHATIKHHAAHVAYLTPANDGWLTAVSIESAAGAPLSSVAASRTSLVDKARNTAAPFPQGNKGVVVVCVDDSLPLAPSHPIPTGRSLALGVGGVRSKVVGKESGGELVLTSQPTVQLSLGCDHRVVDGVLGAQYLQAVKQLLEEPALLAER